MPNELLQRGLLTLPLVLGALLAQTTTRDGVSSTGSQPIGTAATAPVLSQDARFVAFHSAAANLVPNDTNGVNDVFVRDRLAGVTTRVSQGAGGVQSNGGSQVARITPDGRFVAFQSSGSNLVANDTNGVPDIFVHDRLTGVTSIASLGSSGQQATATSSHCSISDDGRFVAFQNQDYYFVAGNNCVATNVYVRDRLLAQTWLVNVGPQQGQQFNPRANAQISGNGQYVVFDSPAPDIVPNDTNAFADVFVYRLATGAVSRVSVSSAGTQANQQSSAGRLSADARYVTFRGYASNLVAGDTNGAADVFVHDRVLASTTRVSVSSAGVQANSENGNPVISGDGRFVAFWSVGTNLVPGDTNNTFDCFLHDRMLGATQRINVSPTGAQASGQAIDAELSADGNHVAFSSAATDLIVPDGNGAVGDVFLRHPGSYAAALNYGTGCPGTGNVVPAIVPIGTPLLGNAAFAVGLLQGLPSSFALLVASLSPGSTPFSGCTVWLGGNIVTVGFVPIDATGAAQVPFAISASPVALGITVYAQFLVADPQGPQNGGVTFSNALSILIGN
ncbi:MAG: PD40 domain-containing protein [Planctomycetes bacterium]|nr:PD40 domain-containing protein [Planctomycetota bacterium]